jgi:hypothetical protein
VVDVVTYALGALVLLVTAVGAYFANGLRSALEGSELAEVWKFIGLGVLLLFLGAVAGVGAPLVDMDTLQATLVFMLLASICFTIGLKLQLDKVK